MSSYNDCPIILKEFLLYLDTIKGRSKTTIYAYYTDLKMFFRYVKYIKTNSGSENDFNKLNISDMEFKDIQNITLSDIHEFLFFIYNKKNNSNKTRARKISSIKSFYKYLCSTRNILENNPAKNLESPSVKKKLPIFMTLDQSLKLLNSIKTDFESRDKCMIVLLLNCGMRISELVNINISDITNNESMRILGKGNKERFVYINKSSSVAISNYLNERNKIKNIIDKDALFISKKGKRIGVRRVQYIIESCLKQAGLSNMGLSAHKFRHTAATLMYQYGNVDIRVIKDVLGHESIATTEIYTHITDKAIKKAIDKNPLSDYNSN